MRRRKIWNLRRPIEQPGSPEQCTEQVAQKQKITDSAGEDRDIVAVAKDQEDAVVQVFFVRDGRLIGRDHFFLRLQETETKAAVG